MPDAPDYRALAGDMMSAAGGGRVRYAMEDTKQKYDIGLPRGGEGGAGGSSADALARIEAAINAVPSAGRAAHVEAVARNVGNPQGLRDYATKAGLTDPEVRALIYETYDHNPTAAKAFANYAATGSR